MVVVDAPVGEELEHGAVSVEADHHDLLGVLELVPLLFQGVVQVLFVHGLSHISVENLSGIDVTFWGSLDIGEGVNNLEGDGLGEVPVEVVDIFSSPTGFGQGLDFLLKLDGVCANGKQ